MYPIRESQLENKVIRYDEIRDFLIEQGFDLGGGWEYDHGYFDRKIVDSPSYLFLRIPLTVVDGEFGNEEAKVKIGTPFVLKHQYQAGLDDYVFVDNSNASFNQFQEPVDPDASLEKGDIERTKAILKQVEKVFMQRFKS